MSKEKGASSYALSPKRSTLCIGYEEGLLEALSLIPLILIQLPHSHLLLRRFLWHLQRSQHIEVDSSTTFEDSKALKQYLSTGTNH